MKPETLSTKALNRALLARQILLSRQEASASSVVSHLVGLQAQQPQPPFVGLWTRVAGFERAALLQLLHDRKIIRSTLMRGTLHLMTADDYQSLRSTLQPGLTAGMHSVLRDRAKALNILDLIVAARALFLKRPLTFTELRAALLEQFPDLDERAIGYAVRTHLPLVAVPAAVDWGFRADSEFAEAESWLRGSIDPEERPEHFVERYLAAFGPATPTDFQAWSGLSAARALFDSLRPRLQTFRDDRKRELFDLPEAPRPPEDAPAPVRFLPGFDNVILSHADRTRIIATEHRSLVTTRNLQVLPTFLVDGFVAGTWKCVRELKTACLTIAPFASLRKIEKAALTEEAEPLARFIEPEAESWTVRFESR